MVGLEDLLNDEDIRFRIARLLADLNQTAEADGAVIAVSSPDDAFRVWPAVPGDIPFGEVSLPIFNSSPYRKVIQTADVVGIRDVGNLPRDQACTFMLAEEFAGYLGAPITLSDETTPSAVLAIVCYDPRDWTRNHHELLSVTATGISDILSGGRKAGLPTH